MDNSKVCMVKSYIFNEISEGRIKSGQRLPSCREVSSRLCVNKITVNKAFCELENEHKVYCIPRGGFYLVETERNECTDDGKKADFCSVRPDDRLIPYREFTHVMNNAVDLYKNSLFGYESPSGLKSLRDALKCRFEKDGVYASGEDIVVTNGAQQSIWLLLLSLFKNKKGRLLVESPTYNLVLKIANQLGIDTIGIEKRKDSFDNNSLENIFSSGDVIAFYIMPRHHNPTGYSVSEKGKQKIAELSAKYNVLILEDDYLADLGSNKRSMPIHYYDTSKKNVAYIRSFSKTFMPGIRLGAAVIPKIIHDDVLNLKHISDLNTSLIQQSALDLYLRSGMYDKHIRKVKKAYESKLKKSDAIFKSLSKEGVEINVPEHGIFIYISLPEKLSVFELMKKLEESNVLVMDAAEFFPTEKQKGANTSRNCIRLCISGVPEDQIDSLCKVVNEINNMISKKLR